MEETKSNWNCVTEYMDKQRPIDLGRYVSYWFHKSPRRMLHSLSYYKFAAKLAGKSKKTLDVGCNEGLGSWVLAKECGYCRGVDFDAEAISFAKRNFQSEIIDFTNDDILSLPGKEEWDAVVSFDVIEHIVPHHAPQFLSNIAAHLKPEGLVIIGTPSLISQQYASEISKKGHINVYSPERLESEMKEHFTFVFMFAANDEIIHTGYLPLAHYLICVGCKKKNSSEFLK